MLGLGKLASVLADGFKHGSNHCRVGRWLIWISIKCYLVCEFVFDEVNHFGYHLISLGY